MDLYKCLELEDRPFLLKMKKLNKKGAIAELGSLIIALVSVGLIIVIGLLIMAETKSQVITLDSVNESNVSSYTAAYNGTVTTQNAMADIPTWLPIIVITVIGALLLGLVQMFRGRE